MLSALIRSNPGAAKFFHVPITVDQSFSSDQPKRVPGIPNLGNTCFANASLQVGHKNCMQFTRVLDFHETHALLIAVK